MAMSVEKLEIVLVFDGLRFCSNLASLVLVIALVSEVLAIVLASFALAIVLVTLVVLVSLILAIALPSLAFLISLVCYGYFVFLVSCFRVSGVSSMLFLSSRFLWFLSLLWLL